MKLTSLLSALFLTTTPFLSAQETIRLAGEARFWLKSPAGQPPITQITTSNGQVTDSTWDKDPEAAKRQKDIRFPIRWWNWQDVTVTFTPTYDGTIDLILNGMWAQEKPGSLYREETLWDKITATGTTVRNGGFEERSGAAPDGWTSSSGNYPEATAWPLASAEALEGARTGASWHNRPLQQTLVVKAGETVTLTLHARSATGPDFIAPKRYGKDTPAHQAAAKLKRGINFGNHWEAKPPGWGVTYTVTDVDQAAAEGFDHIRIPVGWHFYLKPTPEGRTQIAPETLAEIEPVIRRALEKNMHVLLDWHHFYDLDKDPAGNRERFVAGWTLIAEHFKSYPDGLFFELLNEPHDKLTTEILNPIQADAIAAIRKSNPKRTLVVSPGDWGKVGEFDKLLLPDDDNIIVTFHCYEPFFFTHQNSAWTHLGPLKGIVYPGPPTTPVAVPEKLKDNASLVATIHEYNTIQGPKNPSSTIKMTRELDTAKRWSDFFGRPVHLGEFGAIDAADPESRTRYVRDVKNAAEARGIPWTMWDWKAKFAYWDPKANKPLLRGAIFE